MKKPTLSRGISIAGLAIAAVGIATFVVLTFGNKKDEVKQPASQPTAPVQSKEEIKAATETTEQSKQVTTAAQSKDYAKTISTSYAFASKTSNNYQMRLDSYRVCIQAAVAGNDATNKELCYKEGKALLASTKESDQFKQDWQKELDAVYNGTSVPTDNSSGDVQ